MISKKHALFAVFVAAFATSKLADLGMKSILAKKYEEHERALTQAWREGFDDGHKAALNDRYLISRTYMKQALLMELN